MEDLAGGYIHNVSKRGREGERESRRGLSSPVNGNTMLIGTERKRAKERDRGNEGHVEMVKRRYKVKKRERWVVGESAKPERKKADRG